MNAAKELIERTKNILDKAKKNGFTREVSNEDAAKLIAALECLLDASEDIVKNKSVHKMEYHHYSRDYIIDYLQVTNIKINQICSQGE